MTVALSLRMGVKVMERMYLWGQLGVLYYSVEVQTPLLGHTWGSTLTNSCEL